MVVINTTSMIWRVIANRTFGLFLTVVILLQNVSAVCDTSVFTTVSDVKPTGTNAATAADMTQSYKMPSGRITEISIC
jgi:hypothetical protein